MGTNAKAPRVVALGFFDGVHPAHLAVLHAARDAARAKQIPCAAVTFDTHPASVLRGQPPELLQSFDDREHLLREAGGMDEVIPLPFVQWQNRQAEAFLRFLQDGLGAVCAVAGYDYRFGCQAAGSAQTLLRAFGEGCIVVPPILDGAGMPISASRIRALLREGKAAEAAALMGRAFSFTGEVIHGKGLGHTLGFPTLNIPVPEALVCPASGAYASRAHIGGTVYGSVTNISPEGLSETFVFDYDADTYGQTVRIDILQRLRSMRSFPSWEALAAQVTEDKQAALRILRKENIR